MEWNVWALKGGKRARGHQHVLMALPVSARSNLSDRASSRIFIPSTPQGIFLEEFSLPVRNGEGGNSPGGKENIVYFVRRLKFGSGAPSVSGSISAHSEQFLNQMRS
jgi:hypothetical protein